MDLLSFLLSGLPADGTIAAEVAYMFNEWYRPDCYLEFPRGGSQALVQGLVEGLERHGGRLMLSSHVEKVNLDNKGAATGVTLRGGGTIKAKKAVISNASVWDTLKLLPPDRLPEQWRRTRQETPACPSFMHLHIGFDATGLDPSLELHHIVVNTWTGGVTAPQNVVLISIPSVMDPAMAPPGKHCLHAYLPATEPYELWKGLDRRRWGVGQNTGGGAAGRFILCCLLGGHNLYKSQSAYCDKSPWRTRKPKQRTRYFVLIRAG
ncbi:hypothetical protein Vafri_8402 [Volvox africanus]|nr:hypothetical protein Vafri_8402 [Volvox africanus]